MDQIGRRQRQPGPEPVQHAGAADLVTVAKRELRSQSEPPLGCLVVSLEHHGGLDRARRRKAHVSIDLESLAGRDIDHGHAHDAPEFLDGGLDLSPHCAQ